MRNWKTTVAGLVGAIAIAVGELLTKGNLDLQVLLTAAAVAGVGFVAKDFNVTGDGK